MITAAVRTFLWRRAVLEFGWNGLAALIALLGFLLVDIASGDRSWFAGALTAIPAALAALLIAVWLTHYRNSIGKFRAMTTPEAVWTLTDESWTVAAGTGTSTMPWKAITEVWQMPDFWMLLIGKNQFLTLPATHVPAETLAYLLIKTRKTKPQA